jgi:hypothetical protein
MIDNIFPKNFKLKGWPNKNFSISEDALTGDEVLIDVINEDGSVDTFGKFPINLILKSIEESTND